MRPRHAWRRFREEGDPEARGALERRYQHLPTASDALEEFSGPPGKFADFARRWAAGPPPEPTGPPLGVAILSPDMAPRYETLPRLYVAPPKPENPVEPAAAPVVTSLPGPELREVLTAPAPPPPSGVPEENVESAVGALPAAPHTQLAPPNPLGSDRTGPPLTPPAPRTPATAGREKRPEPAAVSQCLGYWKQGLASVHRISHSGAAPHQEDLLGLAIEAGCLRLFGQDTSRSRAHWATLPARTEGEASVIVPRAAVLAKHWGRPGKLLIFDDHVRFEPEGGAAVWAPCTGAKMPAPDAAPAEGGVLAHRQDFLAAIRAAMGGDLSRAGLADEVRLILDDDRLLVVEAPGRGQVRLPIEYGSGDLDARVAPQWLLDALSCAPADEVTVESLGPFSPLRLESGFFTALLATRAAEPYL